MIICNDLEKLEPVTRDRVKAGLEELKTLGIKYYISETWRMQAVQYCYHLQGMGHPVELVNYFRNIVGLGPISDRENISRVTRTVKSKHTEGKAIDLVPSKDGVNPWWSAPTTEYRKIAEVMKKHGMAWGGDWVEFKDAPHYELKE